MIYDLTEEQKEEILKLFKKNPDLMFITRKIFGDETIDGRSKQGRAVRKFLAGQDKKANTSLVPKVEQIHLTKEQKEFLMTDNIEVGMNALEIARLTFKDRDVQPLSIKHRIIVDFLRTYRPEVVDDNEIITKEKWTPPKSINRAIVKINNFCGTRLEELNLQTKQKRLVEQLILYFKSPRFNHFINQYATIADRSLFESEFVRAVWDKPDLTNDELNLYVTVCANYVRQKHIQMRIDKLNALLDDQDNERDITMRLTEIIKATSEELNQCEKRIESLTKDLNGSRTARLKAKGEENGSIFALVEAFQDREERDRMIMMAELQNKLIEEEADRLESMDDYKARILGISKKELL
jgi:hypothetical protein|tara:strand:+ start:1182 stop:2240 length:1059 start_codon:yes stop_codon:yes gene_type:complete